MQVNLQKRENTQTTILALLLTHKEGCTLKKLNSDYYELEGEHIPWKDLGYISLLSFLHSMPKIVQIENKNNVIIVKGIASEKSKHVSKLIAQQKTQKQPIGRKSYKPSHYFPVTASPKIHIPAEILSKIIKLINDHPDGVNKDYVLQEIQSYMPFVNITIKDIEEQLHELSHIVFQTNNKIYPIQSKVKKFDHSKVNNNMPCSKPIIVSHNEQERKSSAVTVAGDEDLDNILCYDEDDVFEFTPYYKKSITKTKSTSSFIKESVSKCQYQVEEPTSTLKAYQNNSYNLINHNYNDSIQVQMEFNNGIKKDEEIFLHKKDVEILINERVKFRLEKLIQNHPDGIWCADLPEKYLEEYKVSLNYTELGFNSVREFASQLPEIFYCVQLHDTGDFMLYYAKTEIPSNKIKKKHKVNDMTELYHIYETSDEEALPAAVSLNTCKILIPDEVMTIGEHVGYINVADLVQDEKPFIEVFVVEIFTPSFFWIQLRKKQKMFKKFMDDLHHFYTMKCDQYVIPPVVLEKGLNCACMYNGIWHRGIIKTVKPDFQVTVMFYDYGTLKTYSPEAVYYLHRMFSNIPAQAIPCGLINTRPCKGSKWSRSATHHFAVRTSEIPLVATIASINTEDNSMMVSLTDTLEEEDVHINDWLVEQKLAEHGKMVCMKKRNFPFLYNLVCQEYFKRQKFSNICKVEINSKNKAVLYNLNTDVDLSYKNNSNKGSCNTKYSYNERMLCNEKNKKLQFFKSNNSFKDDSAIEKKCNSMTNFERKPVKRAESLYEKLLNLKLKSIHSAKISNNNSNDQINKDAKNKKLSNFSLILNRSIGQKLNEKSVKLCYDNVKYNSTKSDNSTADLLVRNKKSIDASDNKYDILKVLNNIPKQYANHFDIQDSEDELDISNIKISTDTCNEIHKTEYTDWSFIWKDAIKEKECVSHKNEFKTPQEINFRKRNDVPLAENCFLKAVYNSSYPVLHDIDICWSATGNINKTSEVSPLILRNIEKRKKEITNNITVAVPRKILETLTDERFSAELCSTSKNIKDIQSNNSLQKISNVSVDNFKCKDNNEILNTKNFEQNSEDYEQNDYICMKVLTPKKKLLEKLLSTKDISGNTINLDSDDLSTSEESVSFHSDSDSNDAGCKKDVYENSANICESITNEPDLKTNGKCLINSAKIDVIDSHTYESLNATISSLKVYEKELSVPSTKISTFTNNVELAEDDLSAKSILSQQTTSTDESDSNHTEEQLSIKESLLRLAEKESAKTVMEETLQTQVVPIKELVPTDIVSETSSIPVFNDINVESDEEEWDVHVSYDDVYNFLKDYYPFNKGIQNRCNYEDFDPCPRIVEINDSNSIENTNNTETYGDTKNEILEVMHSDRIADQEIRLNVNKTKNFTNQYENFETQISVTDSGKSTEIINKYMSNPKNTVSYKLQGKARTLVEMLHKAKLLEKDC